MPKISVFVPVYNTEKYLRQCIDSILAQTFTDFELLLINDGSTDGSGAICDEYAQKDSRVRVFHQENGGVSSARNLGLNNVRGEWISFVDSDDWVKKNFLDKLIVNSENVDLVCVGFIQIEDKLKYRNVDYEGNASECLGLFFENRILGFLWNKLFKTDIIKSNNLLLNESISFREDEEFVLRYFCYITKVNSISYSCYYYDNKSDLSNIGCRKDNFLLSLNCYKTIIELKQNYIKNYYLREFTNSLFDSYKKNIDVLNRQALFKKHVGWDVLKIKEISIFSRLILLLPLRVCTRIFILKAKTKK